MLETEPENRQSESSESTEGAGQAEGAQASSEGSHRRGLLRRSRRAVTKAVAPAFKSGAPDADEGHGQAPQAASRSAKSGAGSSSGRVPAVPGVPVGDAEPGSGGGKS